MVRLLSPHRLRNGLALLLAAVLAAGLGATVVAQSGDEPDSAAAEPVALSVGLGFIPSVQFAQFYLADQAGYYEEAGLEVDLPEQDRP